jgi:hypothetical protein
MGKTKTYRLALVKTTISAFEDVDLGVEYFRV